MNYVARGHDTKGIKSTQGWALCKGRLCHLEELASEPGVSITEEAFQEIPY
jgi:hypothetical protein